MIYSIFSIKDATIYEQYSKMNTGLDGVLEISKVVETTSSYNSRILTKFDLTEFTDNFSSSLLLQTASFYLKLTAANPSEIPIDYTLYAYPISQSWNMGTGRYSTTTTSSNGVSWEYKLSSTNTASAWTTSSFASGTTGSWTTKAGGGNWYTGSAHSQSFNYESSDIHMDVTAAVRSWISGTLLNEGFLIKKSNSDEADTSTEFSALRFFSKESNTIYSPRLEMRYDDSSYQTSHSVVDFTDEVVLNVTNLQEQYLNNADVRINLSARPKYPIRTHATSSNYLDVYQLSSSSFYSIKDAHSENVVIPFDELNTKISADSRGSYFMLNLNTLAPERYYRVLIKSKVSSTEQYIYDNNWIFKVVQ
jgi:hypothetical protein